MASISVIELARCLGEAEPSVRMRALEAAARADLDGVADLVLEKARRERHPKVRAAMLYLVGRTGEAEHIPAVAKFLKDGDAKVRVRTAEALARIGHPSAWPALVRCMGGDEDDRVRSFAAHFLLKQGSQNLLALFAGMIRSEKPWQRQAAVLACQKFNSPLVVPLLGYAAIHDEDGIRSLARSGLERLAALGNQAAGKALRNLPESRGSAEDLSRASQQLEEIISTGHDDMNQTYTGAPVELMREAAADEPFGQVGPVPAEAAAPVSPDPEVDAEIDVEADEDDDLAEESPGPAPARAPGPRPAPAAGRVSALAGLGGPGVEPAAPDGPAAVPAKKKCPLCGSESPATLTKCPRCGTPLDKTIDALVGKPRAKKASEAMPGAKPWMGTSARVLLGLVVLALNGWVAYECWRNIAGGNSIPRVDGDEMTALTRKLKQLVGVVVGGLSLGGVFTGFLTMFQVRSGFVYVLLFRLSWIVYLMIGLLVQEVRLVGVSLAILGIGTLLNLVNRKFP